MAYKNEEKRVQMIRVAARPPPTRVLDASHLLFIYLLSHPLQHPLQITSSTLLSLQTPAGAHNIHHTLTRTVSATQPLPTHIPAHSTLRTRNGTQLATGLKKSLSQEGLGMASAVQAAPSPLSNGVNGIGTNLNGLQHDDDKHLSKAGKVKSKNQLRRQKAKAKKAAPVVQVRFAAYSSSYNQRLTYIQFYITIYAQIHSIYLLLLSSRQMETRTKRKRRSRRRSQSRELIMSSTYLSSWMLALPSKLSPTSLLASSSLPTRTQ